MKKNLLLTTLIWGYASTTSHAYAPSYKRKFVRNAPIKKLKWGLAAGPALLLTEGPWRLSYPPIFNVELKLGHSYSFHANLYGSYRLTNNLGVRLELSYIPQGHKFMATYTFQDHNVPKIQLQAITKPDYIQTRTTLYFFPQKNLGFSLIVGGYVAYLLSAQDQVYAYENEKEIMHESDLLTKEKGVVKSYDAGITLGLGYEWEMGLDLNLISDIGLIKAFQFKKDIYLHTTIDLEARSLSLYVSVGYNFAKLLQ